MGSNNIFTASLSGLNAAMYEINTTQNNIANASTPGYTRQQVVLSSNQAQGTGSGFVGQGVNVATVQRIYDQFLNTQVLQQQGQSSYLNTYLASMTQVDNLLSNTTSGVSNAMQGVFNAVNGLVNTPTSVPARQTVLGAVQTAVNSFQSISQGLTSITSALSGQISSSVQQINSFATQIATLNSSITTAMGQNNGQPPNSLLDQRDQLVNRLNQQIGATTQLQPDGSMSVFIGSGQALVVGNQVMALQAVQNPGNPGQMNVNYLVNGKTMPVQQSSLQGGSLGSYLSFQNNELQSAQNQLGLVALGFASNINQQNQLGVDLSGQPGVALMSVAPPLVTASAANTGTGSVSATVANVSAMTGSDYSLKFDGTNFTLTRLSDSQVTKLTAAQVASPGTVVDGVAISVSAGMAAGDSFTIRPTANAAGSIAMTTTDPGKVAAALPYNGVASIKAINGTMTAALGALTTSTVDANGSTASTDTVNVDGNVLFTSTLPANTAGNLVTPAQLDAAWPAFAVNNPGYTLTGTFAAGTAQITKADGTAISINEVMAPGAGATMTSLAGTGVGFTSLTPSNLTSKIAGITVNSSTNANLANPVVITFTSPTTYTVVGAVPAVAGSQTYTAPNISYNGWTMQLAGGANAPATGDVFSIGANSGTGTVSNGSYNLSPVSINFTSAGTYNVVETTGTPPAPVTLASNVAYTPGSNISYNGWTTQIAGTPATGDTFNVINGSSAATMLATPAMSNTGTGVITGGALSVQPFSIMFNNPPTSYTVSGATPAVTTPVPYVAGQNISYNGWTIQVNGTPSAGDVFNVAPNITGTGDNRNALLMTGLQSQNLMSNGTTTLLGQFNQLVGAVGSKTNELTSTSAAQTTLVTQTVAAQQSVSGVNLDEEAANLLQYQRAYQASAKAMQIANTLFDALLTLR